MPPDLQIKRQLIDVLNTFGLDVEILVRPEADDQERGRTLVTSPQEAAADLREIAEEESAYVAAG